MAIDFETFNPGDAGAFFEAFAGEAVELGKHWWEVNSTFLRVHIKSLGEAVIDTQQRLLEGTLDEKSARRILQIQKMAVEQIIDFSKYMTLVLAQKIADLFTRMIGWAVLNRTGVNLFPGIVG